MRSTSLRLSPSERVLPLAVIRISLLARKQTRKPVISFAVNVSAVSAPCYGRQDKKIPVRHIHRPPQKQLFFQLRTEIFQHRVHHTFTYTGKSTDLFRNLLQIHRHTILIGDNRIYLLCRFLIKGI